MAGISEFINENKAVIGVIVVALVLGWYFFSSETTTFGSIEEFFGKGPQDGDESSSGSDTEDDTDLHDYLKDDRWVASQTVVANDPTQTRLVATTSSYWKNTASGVNQLSSLGKNFTDTQCRDACKNAGAHMATISALLPHTRRECTCFRSRTGCIFKQRVYNGVLGRTFASERLSHCGSENSFYTGVVGNKRESYDLVYETGCKDASTNRKPQDVYIDITNKKCIQCIAKEGEYLHTCIEGNVQKRTCETHRCGSNMVLQNCGGFSKGTCVQAPACSPDYKFDNHSKTCIPRDGYCVTENKEYKNGSCVPCAANKRRKKETLFTPNKKFFIYYDDYMKKPTFISYSNNDDWGPLKTTNIDATMNTVRDVYGDGMVFKSAAGGNKSDIIELEVYVGVMNRAIGFSPIGEKRMVNISFYNEKFPHSCI